MDISEKLTLEKIKQEFSLINSFYFSEVHYSTDGRFFDLYFKTEESVISNKQIETYNKLIENLNQYLIKINDFIRSTYTKSELKKAEELNIIKLNIHVIEISNNNNSDLDAVLVCGKQYKHFRLFKRDIEIRIEIKNGQIMTIERKTDSTRKNGS